MNGQKSKRALVSLSPSTLEAVERLRVGGIENKRFGCEPGTTSETLRRLIIIALEQHEAALQSRSTS